MTDISSTEPIVVQRRKPPRPGFPKLKIGALLNETFRLIGEAFSIAYVAPYADYRRQPRIVPDEDLKGRDPSW